jgi:hypothetical protein
VQPTFLPRFNSAGTVETDVSGTARSMKRNKGFQHASEGGKKETLPPPLVGLPGLALVPQKII